MKIIYFVPAALWFIISVILLTLPGSDLPHSTLFDLPYFDKAVHLGMFFLLTVLFCFPFLKSYKKPQVNTTVFNKIALYIILYGIIMEFVQKFFTAGRSFDVIDIVFDAVGSFAGLLAVKQYVLSQNRRMAER